MIVILLSIDHCRSKIHTRPENGHTSGSGSIPGSLVHIVPTERRFGRSLAEGRVDSITMTLRFSVQTNKDSHEFIHADFAYTVCPGLTGPSVGVVPMKVGKQLGKPSFASLSMGCSI